MNKETGRGVLYVVATPIGNLEDITLRALRVLGEVGLIAAEDTRHTIKLLNRHNIKNRMVSLNADAERSRIPEILSTLDEGKDVAVVSDAGTPSASDPGGALVATAKSSGYEVMPIPGPSAITAALSAAGVTARRFVFEGFLPRTGTKRLARIKSMAALDCPVVIFESPQRVNETLAELHEAMGNRTVSVHREMTKKFEQNVTVTLEDIAEKRITLIDKGEYTIVVMESSPCAEDEDSDAAVAAAGMPLNDMIDILMKYGLSNRDVASAAAELAGVPRNVAYEAVKKNENRKDNVE